MLLEVEEYTTVLSRQYCNTIAKKNAQISTSIFHVHSNIYQQYELFKQ